MGRDRVRASKFLSLVLRHDPARIGLTLNTSGWADVDDLLRRAAEAGTQITPTELLEIVATSDKQRFALSADGTRIRANQGHSIQVDLGLTPRVPPVELYHGTAHRHLDSIRAQGLIAGARQHVHLSDNAETARTVGARHGAPVVLRVRAAAMHAGGAMFFQSENDVWLTDTVPPPFLDVP